MSQRTPELTRLKRIECVLAHNGVYQPLEADDTLLCLEQRGLVSIKRVIHEGRKAYLSVTLVKKEVKKTRRATYQR